MKCTNCGSEVPDSARVCGYCGHRLKAVEPSSPIPAQPLPPPASPVSLQPGYPPALPSPRKKSYGWLWGLFGGLGLLAVIAALGIIILFPFLRELISPGPAASLASPTRLPTNTQLPPATQIPTHTALPPATAEPTAQAAYLPPAIQEKLVDPIEIGRETFEDWSGQGWSSSGNWNYATGSPNSNDQWLELPGVTPWETLLAAPSLGPRGGAYFSFKLSDPPNGVEFYAVQGDRGADSYRRFGAGLYEQGNLVSTISNGADSSLSGMGVKPALEFIPEHWYGLFIGIYGSDRSLLMAWDWDQPDNYSSIDLVGGPAWNNGDWNLVLRADNGTIDLNDFVFIAHDGFR